MFKKVSILFYLFVLSFASYAQKTDDILGKWLNPSGEGQIEIFKKGNKYFGKLVWINEPNDENGRPKTDIKNPNPSLRNKPALGMELLKNFIFEDNKWTDGTIYDPKSGKTYSCNLNLKDNSHLNVRGYIGISLIGRTEVWKRVK